MRIDIICSRWTAIRRTSHLRPTYIGVQIFVSVSVLTLAFRSSICNTSVLRGEKIFNDPNMLKLAYIVFFSKGMLSPSILAT